MMYYVMYKHNDDVCLFELENYTEEIGGILNRFVGVGYDLQFVSQGNLIFSEKDRVENVHDFLYRIEWEVKQNWYDDPDEVEGYAYREFLKLREILNESHEN